MNATLIASLVAAMAAFITVIVQAQSLSRAARLRTVIRDYLAITQTLPEGKSRRTLLAIVDEKVAQLAAHEHRKRYSWPVLILAVATTAVGVAALSGAEGWERWVAAFDVVMGVGIGVTSFALTRHARDTTARTRHDAHRSISTNRA